LQLFLTRNWTSQIVGSLESFAEHAMVLTILFWQNNENKQEYVVIVNWALERRKKFGRKQKQKQININLFFCQNVLILLVCQGMQKY
jgi:hypothetical protein